jgi:hypothetical protein
MEREQLHELVSDAVKRFWQTRREQRDRQGRQRGEKDSGLRGSVTGGKQLDGFAQLVRTLLCEVGLAEDAIRIGKQGVTLPGYFRPTKEWDLLVLVDNKLLASIEFKSHVGPSFGNNFNNRTEEALGSATDLWTAFREGAFQDSVRPWLGYFMLLELAPESTRPTHPKEPHFPVFAEFKDASYFKRYELFCTRLLRERLYDAACLIGSSREDGREGIFTEPSEEIGFFRFAASLTSHASAFLKLEG